MGAVREQLRFGKQLQFRLQLLQFQLLQQQLFQQQWFELQQQQFLNGRLRGLHCRFGLPGARPYVGKPWRSTVRLA